MIGALLWIAAANAAPLSAPLFDLVDRNHDDVVSDAELALVREGLGFPLSRKEARATLGRRVDPAGFDAWVEARQGPPDEDERERMFGIVDDNGDGLASPREIGSIAAVVAHELTRDDIERVVALYDIDGDAALTPAEFARMHEEASLRSTFDAATLAIPIADAFDPDADGFANPSEIGGALYALGVDIRDPRPILTAWDANGDRQVTTDEIPVRR